MFSISRQKDSSLLRRGLSLLIATVFALGTLAFGSPRAYAADVVEDISLYVFPSFFLPGSSDSFPIPTDAGASIEVFISGRRTSPDLTTLKFDLTSGNGYDDASGRLEIDIRNVYANETKIDVVLNWPGVLTGNRVFTQNEVSGTTDASDLTAKNPICGFDSICYQRVARQLLPADQLIPNAASVLQVAPTVDKEHILLGDTEESFTVSIAPAHTREVPGTSGKLKVSLQAPGTAYTESIVQKPATCVPPVSETRFDPGFSVTIPPYNGAEGSSWDCTGTYTITSTTDYNLEAYDNGSFVALQMLPYSGSATVEVTAEADVEYTTLVISFLEAPAGTAITDLTGAEVTLVPISTVDGYDPADIEITSSGNQITLSNIFPERYNVRITPPQDYRGTYTDTSSGTGPQEVNVGDIPNVDLTQDQQKSVSFCPDGLASCTPSTDIEEAEPDPVGPGAGEESSGGETEVPLCVPEEMFNFAMGWLYRPMLEMFCGVVDISLEASFPLLDVNIPLVRTEGDGVVITKRKMFENNIAKVDSLQYGPETGNVGTGAVNFGSWIGQQVVGILQDTYTPHSVYLLWNLAYQIASSGVVVAIVIYGMMIIFRYDVNKYSLKTFLVNTIFAIVLATFSYQISTLMFDLNKVLALFIQDAMISVFGDFSGQTVTLSGWIKNVLNWMSPVVLIGGGIYLATSLKLLILPCISCMLSYALSIISVWIILYARAVFLYVLVIASPIVFMMRVIPEFQGESKTWFNSMFRILTLYPLAVLFYYLLLVMGSLFSG
jgi:hypothetical protein